MGVYSYVKKKPPACIACNVVCVTNRNICRVCINKSKKKKKLCEYLYCIKRKS